MQNKQLPPFNRGDEVVDDNAEIGYVLENYIDATWDAAGNLTNWRTRIHYRWDQPSYGLTRVVSEGEISLLTQRAPDVVQCAACKSTNVFEAVICVDCCAHTAPRRQRKTVRKKTTPRTQRGALT